METFFAHLIAPVVTTAFITVSSNTIYNGDILMAAYPGCAGEWPFNMCLVVSLETSGFMKMKICNV